MSYHIMMIVTITALIFNNDQPILFYARYISSLLYLRHKCPINDRTRYVVDVDERGDD